MTAFLVLVLANVDLVADGKPVARLSWEGGPRAEAAARILNKTLVLMTGTARLPQVHTLPPSQVGQLLGPGEAGGTWEGRRGGALGKGVSESVAISTTPH